MCFWKENLKNTQQGYWNYNIAEYCNPKEF